MLAPNDEIVSLSIIDNDKNLKNGKKSKKIQSLYSAGKSVHTIHKIESATSIMQHLGQSINISNIYN